ncbi:MAG: hypothetical protein GXO90_06045 [FCB group bacterium]|nr:hypothetical protein [FCB group bacterium]
MILFWTLIIVVLAGLGMLASIAYYKVHDSRPPEADTRPAVIQSGTVSFQIRNREGKLIKGSSVEVTLFNGQDSFPVIYNQDTKLFTANDVFTPYQLEATVVYGESITKKVVDMDKVDTIVLNDYFNNVVLVNGSLKIDKEKLRFEVKNLGQGEYRAQSGVLYWDNSSLALARIKDSKNVLWDADRDHQGFPVFSGMTVPFLKDFKLKKDGKKEKLEFRFTKKVRDISAVTLKLFSEFDVDQIIAVTMK